VQRVLKSFMARPAVARGLTPLNEKERKQLSDGILAERKVAMAEFLGDHLDA
jgi:hypothetical protein